MSHSSSRANIWAETPLHGAARADDLGLLERALAGRAPGVSEAHPSVDAPDVLGFTALHVAACEASVALVERLLDAGAAVDARAKDGITPLMLAVARGRRAVVDRLLDAGADPNPAVDSPSFPMLLFLDRGASLPMLERLAAGGYVPATTELTLYLRVALELTGHRVRYAERGYCRGIAGDTDDVWVVDRPMTLPAALMAPMVRAHPSLSHAAGGLAAETWFYPWYAATFATRAEGFEGAADLGELGRGGVQLPELAHEVRCGRHGATQPAGSGGWSPLARAVTGEEAAIVLALVRSAGLDPAVIAEESEEERVAREAERGLYPVHRGPLRELLRRALDDEPDAEAAGRSRP